MRVSTAFTSSHKKIVYSILTLFVLLCSHVQAEKVSSPPVSSTTQHVGSSLYHKDQQGDYRIVSYLKYLVSIDSSLKATLVTALKHQKKGSYWYGKNLDDFYQLFNKWLVEPPSPDMADSYDMYFYKLVNSGPWLRGNTVIMGYLAAFMNARHHFLQTPASAKYMKEWMHEPSIDIKDFVVPEGGFKTWEDFFLRHIKPGVRPIAAPDNPAVFVSPADCYYSEPHRLLGNRTFSFKGDVFDGRELLGHAPLAKKFDNGYILFCHLQTVNYHHFHAPVSGKIIAQRWLGGLRSFDETNATIRNVLTHERAYIIFDTHKYGYVAMVPIGMWTINSVKLNKHVGDKVYKGEMVGNFDYGGSEIALLFEPGRVKVSPKILSLHGPVGPEGAGKNTLFLKVGQKIGRGQGSK